MKKLSHYGIDHLEIHTRTSRVLNAAGLSLIMQIDDKTDFELMIIPGCGKKTLRDIRDAIDQFRRRWHRQHPQYLYDGGTYGALLRDNYGGA